MTFDECIKTLQQQAVKKGINYTLARLDPFLEQLGNPHQQLGRCIHVAGTNGKGSTIAFMESILMEAGHSVACFTSPHLLSYTERIRKNRTPVTQAEFIALFDQVKPFFKQGLTEFEALTLMFFLYIQKKQPDVCLLEVGLGGRLDATNVVQPELSIITSISYDHQAILGDTLASIAAEKAGIIKPGVPVFTLDNQQKEARDVLDQTAALQGSDLVMVTPAELPRETYLKGVHQGYNAALATKAIHHCFPDISQQAIEQGLAKAQHWGRCMHLETAQSQYVIDAAHNPAGVDALRTYLEDAFPGRKRTVVFGLHQSKDIKAMTRAVSMLADNCYYCEWDSTWAAPYQDVTHYAQGTIAPWSVDTEFPQDELVVITGSIYFLGYVKSRLDQI